MLSTTKIRQEWEPDDVMRMSQSSEVAMYISHRWARKLFPSPKRPSFPSKSIMAKASLPFIWLVHSPEKEGEEMKIKKKAKPHRDWCRRFAFLSLLLVSPCCVTHFVFISNFHKMVIILKLEWGVRKAFFSSLIWLQCGAEEKPRQQPHYIEKKSILIDYSRYESAL